MNKFPMFSGAAPIDDRGILDALRGSEIVQKAAAERNTHVVAFRKTVASNLAKLEADAEARFPKLRADLEVAVKEAHAAEKAWRAKADRARSIQAQLSAEHGSFIQQQANFDRQLAETASPEILPWITEMWAMWEDCPKRLQVHNSIETIGGILQSPSVVTRSNRASVFARRDAIRDAIEAAEKMKLEPDQSTVSARLHELRQSLPDIKDA